MTTDTLRQIFGTLRTPNGSAFPNKSLKWFRERRTTVAQGSSVVLDDPFIVTTDAEGDIDTAVMAGAYLVMAPLSDADRYFRVVVPDQAGPFDISSLIDGPTVEPDDLTQFEVLVAKAKAWANAPENTVVEGGEFSAKHYAIRAGTALDASLAKAEQWAENSENAEVESGKYSAKHWAAKAEDEKQAAEVARAGAEAAESSSETARDAAFVNADVYADVATGRAAVADGDQFQVVSGNEIIRYRRDSSTTQTEMARYPSAAIVRENLYPPHFDAATYSTFNYTNADPLTTNVSVADDRTTIVQSTARLFGYTGTLQIGESDLSFTVEATVNTGAGALGVQFTDGSNRLALNWALVSGGRMFAATSVGVSALIGINLGTFTTGDVITFEVALRPTDATAQVVVRKNGDFVGAYGLSSVPLGVVGYVVQGGANLTFRLLEAEVSQEETARESVVNSQLLTLPERRILRAQASFLSDIQRPIPPLFAASPAGAALLSETGIQVFKKSSGAGFFTNIEPSDFNELREGDRGVVTLYVDAATGSTGATGTKSDPIKSLNDAILRVSGFSGNGVADRVIIKARGGNYFGADSFNGLAGFNRRLSILSWDGVPIISSPHLTGLSWSLSTGTTYTADLTGLTSSVPAVWDARADQLDANGDWKHVPAAASQAACESTPGTYFVSGSTIHLNLADGRAPDADVRVYPFNVGNFGYRKDGGLLYMENVRLLGGTFPITLNTLSTTLAQRVFSQDCEFSYGSTGDNFVSAGDVLSVLKRCTTAFAKADGFDYHRYPTGGRPARAIEIDCIGRSCGLTPNATNNSTMHDRGAIIRVNGDYFNCLERAIHDIEGYTSSYPTEYANAHTVSWNLGCDARDGQNPTTAPNWQFGGGNPTERLYAWLDTCSTSGSAGFKALDGDSGADFEIHTANFDAGGGLIDSGADITEYDPTAP